MPVTRTSGQGRPKGAANKTTSEVKAMVIAAVRLGVLSIEEAMT